MKKSTISSDSPSEEGKSLDRNTASKVVDMLKSGKMPAEISKKLDVGYMAVYKIATGKTWKGLTGGVRMIEHRKGKIGPIHREYVRRAKAKGKSNAFIARKLKVSETTAARLATENRLIDAHKLRAALLTSGDQDAAARAVGLRPRDADALLDFATNNPLPKRLEEYIG